MSLGLGAWGEGWVTMSLSEKIFARWALIIKNFSSWKFEEADLADCVLKRQAMTSKDGGELVGTGAADMQHIPWTRSTIGWWTRWKRKPADHGNR